MTEDPKLRQRVEQYLSLNRPVVKVKEFLGAGTDGAVWSTDDVTAIKTYLNENGYFNERDAYLRLAEFGVTQRIGDFWVPQMVGHNDELLIVEMDIMHSPPFIIDFAKVRFWPPEFSDDVVDYSESRGLEKFEDKWPAVRELLSDLESYQIYYLDPTPNNIVFPP
jgi:hypothetical protein